MATTLAAGLLVAGPGAGSPAQAAATSARSRPDLAAQFVGSINGARAGAGRPRLAVDSALTRVAAGWASHMATRGVLAHNPGLASQMHGWKYLGENVGVGDNVPQLCSAFMASAAHRANVLDRDFTRVGVAVVQVGNRLWVVEDFSRPAGSASRPAPAQRSRPVARPASTRTVAPARPRGHKAVKPLAAKGSGTSAPDACDRQAARLFEARHEPRGGAGWTWPESRAERAC